MLKQPTRIFQITGKQILNDKVIRFFLHDNLNYLDGGFNLIHCANASPYNGYEVGDCLGISIGEIERGENLDPSVQEIFNNTILVKKVVKVPENHNGTTFDDLCFGRG